MMAQNTSEDEEIAEWIPVGASNDYLKSYVHKRLKYLGLEERPISHERDYFEFLRRRGMIYEEALGQARPLNDTRSEAEREEDVKRIEDLLVWNMVNADFQKYRQGQPACGRIECWAASQKFVNIVVALVLRGPADDPESPTPMSKGLLALTIAAENNDLTMVDALKDIAVAGESFESREPDSFSPRPELNFFYSDCDRPVYKLYPSHKVWLCPIEAAARLGHVGMVTKLILLSEAKMKADQEELSYLMMNNKLVEGMMEKILNEMMTREKLKCRRAFNWALKMGHREVVIEMQYTEDLNEASDVHGLLDNADIKSYGWRQTPLALAVLSAKFEIVKVLCTYGRGLRTDAKNEKGQSAIQIAFEKSRYRSSADYRFQGRVRDEIWNFIMERADSRREVKRLTEEKKVHVDAINAILVGTALIATATFAGWLSPPLGYSSPPGMDGPFASVEGHPILEKFWVFNSLSFFFSIATFMVGANVAFPPPEHTYIGDVVQTLRWKLTLAYFLVSAAVCFVIGAFACAGFAVLPPIPKYTVNMALTVGIGVTVVAVVVFVSFFGHMFTTGLRQLEHKMELLCRAGQQVEEV